MVLELRQARDVHVPQGDTLRLRDVTFDHLFEVEAVPNLARLSDALAILKALPSVVGDGVLSIVDKVAKHEIAADKCARATLTGITVHEAHILWVL